MFTAIFSSVLTVCLLASSFGDPLKFAVLRAKRKNLLTTAQLIVETFFEEGSVHHSRLVSQDRTVKQEQDECYKELVGKLDSSDSMMFLAVARVGPDSAGSMDQKIIGFAEVCESSDFCFKLGNAYQFKASRPMINSLVVHKDFRCLGVGFQLLAACIAQAKVWRHTEVMLEVRDDNIAGIRFYTRLGFAENLYARGMDPKAETGLYMRNIPQRNNQTAEAVPATPSPKGGMPTTI